MSMVINLVEDHNIYLCEGGPVYNGGVQPTPITYLTQWKIVGNSQVHTDPYLTSWKVSGNSVVDNNTILSCGDLGQDGKYHVKISNGVDIYDIALDEPLRKVNDVADIIEFPSDTDGKALVTRNLKSIDLGTLEYTKRNDVGEAIFMSTSVSDRKYTSGCVGLIADLTQKPSVASGSQANNLGDKEWCYYYQPNKLGTAFYIRLMQYGNYTAKEFKSAMIGKEFIYELATPTTELVDAPQIAVSTTDTYTSANATPYSAFEHTENKEIWSCGEYNPIDGKYHILVQPQGGSIADIALTEPLRKVNNVADIIEFPSSVEGKALVTRNFALLSVTKFIADYMDSQVKICKTTSSFINGVKYDAVQYGNVLCNKIENALPLNNARFYIGECFALYGTDVWIRNGKIEQTVESYQSYFDSLGAIEVVYQLATPTTELVNAPQIEEADSYTCEISQGGKAVSWSSFETNSE